jgi:ribosomal protein S18 acetylase RimI-like enzyme
MPEVARVFRASFSHALPWIPTLHTPQDDHEHFTQVVFDENTVLVAREACGSIIGFISFREGYVSNLYVLPERCGQGVGSRLLNAAKQRAAGLELWAFQRNTPALRFYEKHGFRVVRETDGFANEEREPDVLLAWRRE